MNATEHLKKGEQALEGAKEMLRLADEEPRGVVGLATNRTEYLDKATFLIAVANVHAHLGRLANLVVGR